MNSYSLHSHIEGHFINTNNVLIKDAYRFCPQCGAGDSPAGTNPFRCSACGYLQYFSPCTAVAAVIEDADGKILFIVREKDPGTGKFGLPGGFVDAGESAEQALIREVQEELNLNVLSYDYLASFPNEYAFSGVISPVTDLFFVTQVTTFNGMKAQAGEVRQFAFRAAGSVGADELAFDTHRKALVAYLQHKSS